MALGPCAGGSRAQLDAIFASNRGAARFYESAGFGPRGTLLRKELGRPSVG
jgi:hypothetical protein